MIDDKGVKELLRNYMEETFLQKTQLGSVTLILLCYFHSCSIVRRKAIPSSIVLKKILRKSTLTDGSDISQRFKF